MVVWMRGGALGGGVVVFRVRGVLALVEKSVSCCHRVNCLRGAYCPALPLKAVWRPAKVSYNSDGGDIGLGEMGHFGEEAGSSFLDAASNRDHLTLLL